MNKKYERLRRALYGPPPRKLSEKEKELRSTTALLSEFDISEWKCPPFELPDTDSHSPFEEYNTPSMEIPIDQVPGIDLGREDTVSGIDLGREEHTTISRINLSEGEMANLRSDLTIGYNALETYLVHGNPVSRMEYERARANHDTRLLSLDVTQNEEQEEQEHHTDRVYQSIIDESIRVVGETFGNALRQAGEEMQMPLSLLANNFIREVHRTERQYEEIISEAVDGISFELEDDEPEQDRNAMPNLDIHTALAASRLFAEYLRNVDYNQMDVEYSPFSRSYMVSFRIIEDDIVGYAQQQSQTTDAVDALARTIQNIETQKANERYLLQSIVELLTNEDASIFNSLDDIYKQRMLDRLIERAKEILSAEPTQESITPLDKKKPDDGKRQAGRRRIRLRGNDEQGGGKK